MAVIVMVKINTFFAEWWSGPTGRGRTLLLGVIFFMEKHIRNHN
jgi:hypothetical protein